ncbi:MAG TPA: hypothetical protein VM934_09820 [Pyrinomonadaceae bacterium]|nr:hypothetical protein [Pyrinomonadaceae bacterium]
MRSKEDAHASERREERPRAASRLKFVWHLYPVLLVTVLPVALASNLWLEMFDGTRSRATDGSGHWGIAQIYGRTIFPDTFGWTHAYFGGMPFPNFYPPLFHWCVALLYATGLVPLGSAFKAVLATPLLLLPASVWLLAWRVSDKNRTTATAAGCAVVLLLTDMRFQVSTCGLDYSSTFNAGFYTQPLGFVLLLAWYVVYLGAHKRRWRSALACVLLALTVLSNFFNAFTGALFIAATLAADLLRWRRAISKAVRDEARRAFAAHFLTPLVALGLALFWLVPMFASYDYFVTRPLILPLGNLVSASLWGWYAAAALGILLWLRKPTGAMWSYLAALAALACAVLFASTLSPRWFPLQAFRFFATLNFLLAVPVGKFLATVADSLKIQFRAPLGSGGIIRHLSVVGVALLLIGLARATQPTPRLAFYSPAEDARIEAVLGFAREHADGRYLVESLSNFQEPQLQPDGPALNAYLGAQGNETLSVVYREASPNSLFFNAQANAFSNGTDNFGLSSVLADDLDFRDQPLARHLERARFLGVRYLVVGSDEMKERLSREPSVGARRDFDRWSIFELKGAVAPRVRALEYMPALVVGDFSVKGRRRNEYDFMRLAAEQFNDNWFDVLLARSPTSRIDRLENLDDFGALVLDTYACDDEARAFEQLRAFAARRPLILLSSDAPLFRRISADISAFPLARIVKRPASEEPGEPIESFEPSFHYDGSSVRAAWREIRQHLEEHKLAVAPSSSDAIQSDVMQNRILLSVDEHNSSRARIPVLIATTYFPNWHRTDGGHLYAATPFFTLTFIREPAQIVYERRSIDRLGLWISIATMFALCAYVARPRRIRRPSERTAL